MHLATQSNTQVYSPFGSYVVERHANGDQRRLHVPEPPISVRAVDVIKFEVPDVLLPRQAGDVLSNEQAAVALALQRYYQLHSVGPTPSRLQMLLNELMEKSEVDVAAIH